MTMIRTMFAGALLTLGTGVVLGQTQAPPAAEDTTNTTAPAEESDAAQPATGPAPADSTDAAATPQPSADAPAAPAPASAPAAQSDGPSNQAASAEQPSAEKEAALDTRAAKRAKRKAQCEAINVGKPRDC